MYYDYSVLVIADPEFQRTCSNQAFFVERLKTVLQQRAGGTQLRMVTVEGKYAFPGLEKQPTDDRTKTAFVKSMDDYLTQLNEVIIVTNFSADAFIAAVTTRLSEARISTTSYGYMTDAEKP